MYLHSTIRLRLLANRFCRDTGRGVRVFETSLTIRHDLTKSMQTPLSYVGPLIRCLGVWPLALYLQRISIAILFHALSLTLAHLIRFRTTSHQGSVQYTYTQPSNINTTWSREGSFLPYAVSMVERGVLPARASR